MPSRRALRTHARPSSRLASLLFVLGCLVVLGVTFALGVAAGRRWPNGWPGFGGSRAAAVATTSPSASNERERRAETRGPTKTTAEAPPVLTFYRELTAPLVSLPPPTRSLTGAGAKSTEPLKPSQHPPQAPKPASDTEPRFTVQVGAFKTRSQADALQARLAASGQDAYVTEGHADGITQYRVRIGSFATREAAREAAARLASERQVATYVTTR